MKSAASVLGLVIVLAIGYWVYKAELVPGPQGGTPVLEQGDIAGVASDLITIGQAERLYLASHGARQPRPAPRGRLNPFRRHPSWLQLQCRDRRRRALQGSRRSLESGMATLSADETLQAVTWGKTTRREDSWIASTHGRAGPVLGACRDAIT